MSQENGSSARHASITIWPRTATMLLLLASLAVAASAQTTFTAEDLNAGPGASHPNSSAAAAAFTTAASALGTPSTITFESVPVGTFSTLTVAPGVTISGTNYLGSPQSINNTPNFPSGPALDGFNTTPGGSKYVEMLGGTLTFTFATPTQFFGAYFEGVQTSFFQDTLTFSDGTTHTINFPGLGTNSSNGALDFVGFTDAGKLISSITITGSVPDSGADFFGVDDAIYQASPTSAPTPEPGSIVLLLTGCLGVAGKIRQRLIQQS